MRCCSSPGLTFCSGTLIGEDTILTAATARTSGRNPSGTDGPINEVLVSFAPQAEVDEDWNPVRPEDWHVASSWTTHPLYVGDEWPFTYDYGLLFLDEAVSGSSGGAAGARRGWTDLIGEHGQTAARFNDVGYGQNGVLVGGGKPVRNFTWTRKVATERYAPGNGSVSGIFHPTWFITQNSPSSQHGGGCGGDSGSGIFPAANPPAGDVVLAVHTGGYRLGSDAFHLRPDHVPQPSSRHSRGPRLDRGRVTRTLNTRSGIAGAGVFRYGWGVASVTSTIVSFPPAGSVVPIPISSSQSIVNSRRPAGLPPRSRPPGPRSSWQLTGRERTPAAAAEWIEPVDDLAILDADPSLAAVPPEVDGEVAR